jgi:hypothetical protein
LGTIEASIFTSSAVAAPLSFTRFAERTPSRSMVNNASASGYGLFTRIFAVSPTS